MLRIEHATPADLTAIRALLAAAALPTADVDASLLSGFLVLRARDTVRGAAAVEAFGSCALLRSLVVADELRAQGYGAKLMTAAQDLAAARGLAPLYLLTTTAADYFERHGYRRVDRVALPAEVRASQEFSTLCPDTAVALVKP